MGGTAGGTQPAAAASRGSAPAPAPALAPGRVKNNKYEAFHAGEGPVTCALLAPVTTWRVEPQGGSTQYGGGRQYSGLQYNGGSQAELGAGMDASHDRSGHARSRPHQPPSPLPSVPSVASDMAGAAGTTAQAQAHMQTGGNKGGGKGQQVARQSLLPGGLFIVCGFSGSLRVFENV